MGDEAAALLKINYLPYSVVYPNQRVLSTVPYCRLSCGDNDYIDHVLAVYKWDGVDSDLLA